MNHDDIELDHYRVVIEDFLYNRGVEPEDTCEAASDLLDLLRLNGWKVVAL